MFKTPISLLQEGLIKAGKCPPVYTEVSTLHGAQINEFVICVACDKQIAKGAGATKKEAKQNAAKAMIKLLDSLNSFPSLMPPTEQKALEQNLQMTCSEDVFTNYVGSLMEYSAKNVTNQPKFEVVSISGESHSPIFTMKCTIGSVCKTASATTKKAAKQKVAKEVLQHLKVNIINNDETSKVTVEFMNLKLDLPTTKSNQEIRDIYGKLKDKPITSARNLKVTEYHILMADLYKNTFKMQMHALRSLYQKEEYCARTVTEIKAIIEENVNASIKMINIRSGACGQCIVGISLTTIPSVVRIAMANTVEQAEKKVLNKLLQYIIFFST